MSKGYISSHKGKVKPGVKGKEMGNKGGNHNGYGTRGGKAAKSGSKY